jgi:hypothetical protein
MDRGERVLTICRRVFPVVADDNDDDVGDDDGERRIIKKTGERRTNAFVQAYVTQ